MWNDSVILRHIVAWYFMVKALYESSLFYGVYHGIGRRLSRVMDNSAIIGLFRQNWDAALSISPRRSRCLRGLYHFLRGPGNYFLNSSSSLAQAVRESYILRMISGNFIVLGIYALFFAIPFLPTMLLAALCLLLLGLYALEVFIGRRRLRVPHLLSVMAALFGVCYIYAAFTSYHFPKSVEVMLLFLCFLSMFFVIGDCINTETKFRVLINVFLLSAVIVALYGIYQYSTGVAMDAAWVDEKSFEDIKARAFATFSNPNVLGEYLIMTASVGVGMLWKAKRLLWKGVYAVVCGILVLGLAATNSRGAMLGLLLSAAVFVLLSERRLLLIGLAGLCLLPFVLPQTLWERLASVATLADSSSLYRVSIYKASMNILQNYWVSGIGLDAFNAIYPLFSYEAAYAYHSHNLFLQEFIELGILGFSMFLGTLLLFFQRLYFGIRNSRREYKYMLGAIMGGFAGMLLQGMVDHLWFDYSIVLLFWAVMGLGHAAVKIGVKTAHER